MGLGLLAVPTLSLAVSSEGVDPSVLAPGLVQANQALSRLERLTDEAEAISTALFRTQNLFGEHRVLAATPPDCTTPWLLDLGARSRELGRASRDSVQSARVQARRMESLTVQPTVQPLLDPETNHKILSLLGRVDDLVRRYPEAATWQDTYLEPLLKGCPVALVPAPGIPDAAPPAKSDDPEPLVKRPKLIAVIAFGGGWLCPGAEPAAGVMLVAGDVCYSTNESCDCEALAVSPAMVLGPATNAGSAN